MLEPHPRTGMMAAIRGVPGVAGAIAILVGVAALLGWAADVAWLRGFAPGQVAMNPLTAIGLVGVGVALLLASARRAPRVRQTLALAVGLMATVKLYELASGQVLGFDRLLFRAALDTDAGLPPNRMAPNTAVGLLLVAVAIGTSDLRTRRGIRPAQWIALAPMVLAGLAMLGYWYGVRAFYGVHSYIPMALNTAVALFVTSLGVFFLAPEDGLAALALDEHSGGFMLRRILPLAFLSLGLLGWMELTAHRAGLIDDALGVSILIAASVMLLAVANALIATRLGHIEADRNAAAAALKVAHDDLERRVALRTEQLLVSNRELEDEVRRRREVEASLVMVTRAVEQTADLVLMTDRHGTIEYVNPAFTRHSGFSEAELIGQNPRLLRSGEQDAEFYERLWRTVLDGQVFRGVFINRKKSGELYHEEKTISPIRDATGAITHFVATGADVTERVRLEQQLRQAQKMEAIGRLAGGVSHDFNNLLTAILGFGNMALADLPDEGPLHSRLVQMVRAGERAASLTRQLLAFSRQQVLKPQVVDLNHVVADIEKLLRRLIGADISLETGLAGDLGQVWADPGQIGQVLMNLAVNARDAMPAGGKLTIETMNVRLEAGRIGAHSGLEPGHYVLLVVSDTGCGMDEATRAQIFDPFFTTKGPGEGTGLGLSTVHGIVSQSGGQVEVYSEPGRGATFKVYLPRVGDAAQEPRSSRPRSADLRGTERVLVVEDEDLVRAMVCEALRGRGYEVLAARNGDVALDLAAAHAPLDAVISDVVLPGTGGPEVCARLLEQQPGLPVMLMSGYTDRSLHHRGVITPDTCFLQKPFTADELLEALRGLLDRPARGGATAEAA